MDITPYVEALRRDLVAVAEAGGDETRAAADRLLLSLEPAVRLTLMDALSQAAAEITSELPAGSVEVRLRGREPELVVDVPDERRPASAPIEPDDDDADGAVARITLRLPEPVKTRVEELAARSGRSLNSWIVGALRAASRERVGDLAGPPDAAPRGHQHGRRMTGWV